MQKESSAVTVNSLERTLSYSITEIESTIILTLYFANGYFGGAKHTSS